MYDTMVTAKKKEEEKKQMKKIFVLLLIFLMSISMIACGGNDDEIVQEPDNTAADNVSGDALSEESGESEAEEGKIDTSDLVIGEEGEVKFDFGFTVSDDFAMSGAIKKISYTDISKQLGKLEDMMGAAVKKALSGEYPVFSDYEEDDSESIDKLAYVLAMEDDDSEKSFLETGAYHSKTDNKYYQYTVYTSDNFYDNSKENIKRSLGEIKSAYGITVSQKTVEKAVKEVLKVATETEDYYSLYEEKSVKGSGYTEKVKLSVDGFATEDNKIGYYISVERERCYN